MVAIAFWAAQFPKASVPERQSLASRFRFEKQPVKDIPDHPPYRQVRRVHPSLEHISAWISSLGASASLADLDGDGLSNDLVLVDPRTDRVTVSPVPNTGDRFPAFVLSPSPLPYEEHSTAPMGTLIGDFNEDGRLDILVYYWGRTPILFLRNEETLAASQHRSPFTPVELSHSGERWYSNCALQADLDGDGHIDLVIGNYFPDGAHILDAEADGIEEMHAGKAKALNGGKKHVFLWTASKNVPDAAPRAGYVEVPNPFGTDANRGWTLAMGAGDLDGDQLPELYLSNDFGPDRLLHNLSTPGHLQFQALTGHRDFHTPKSCVLGQDSFKGMGCDFADVNGDGVFDIYVSNIATQYALTESHFVWLSQGSTSMMKEGLAPYIQASEDLGLSRSGWGWDCRFADFDNDGALEAVQAVGFIKGKINRWPELQALGTSNSRLVHDPRIWPNFKPGADLSGHDLTPFFTQAADGRYCNIGREVGWTQPMVSKGIALADVDGDGRLDMVFANQWEDSVYCHNESPSAGAFLGLHLLLPVSEQGLQGVRSHADHPDSTTRGRPAYGATARVELPNGRKLLGQVDGGNGHSGRRSPEIHFGLGSVPAKQLLSVELRWRDVLGHPQSKTLSLSPGWHTLMLGSANELTHASIP